MSTMNVNDDQYCEDCLNRGKRVQQAFAPREVAFLLAAVTGSLQKVGAYINKNGGSLPPDVDMPSAAAAMHKLLMSLPPDVRSETLKHIKAFGVEVDVLCECKDPKATQARMNEYKEQGKICVPINVDFEDEGVDCSATVH